MKGLTLKDSNRFTAKRLMSFFSKRFKNCWHSLTNLRFLLCMFSQQSSMTCLISRRRKSYRLLLEMTIWVTGMTPRLSFLRTLQIWRQLSSCVNRWLKYNSNCKLMVHQLRTWVNMKTILVQTHRLFLLSIKQRMLKGNWTQWWANFQGTKLSLKNKLRKLRRSCWL